MAEIWKVWKLQILPLCPGVISRRWEVSCPAAQPSVSQRREVDLPTTPQRHRPAPLHRPLIRRRHDHIDGLGVPQLHSLVVTVERLADLPPPPDVLVANWMNQRPHPDQPAVCDPVVGDEHHPRERLVHAGDCLGGRNRWPHLRLVVSVGFIGRVYHCRPIKAGRRWRAVPVWKRQQSPASLLKPRDHSLGVKVVRDRVDVAHEARPQGCSRLYNPYEVYMFLARSRSATVCFGL